MVDSLTLTAAGGLALHLDADLAWRLSWREADWLGPLAFAVYHGGQAATALAVRVDRFEGADDLGEFEAAEVHWAALPWPLRTTVRAYRALPLIVFRLEAPQGCEALSTDHFEYSSAAWPVWKPTQRRAGGVPDGSVLYGHQYAEFALPVFGDAEGRGFLFAPHRPAVVEPLLCIAPDGRTLLLAPLDQFHEQIIAVPREAENAADGVRCGWHGDLERVPPGFASELAVWAGAGPRVVLDEWAAALRRRHATERPSRYADDGVGKLSYWTDNGAVYYYRTERDCDYTTTLERVVADARAHQVPVSAVQLDSWFYPHEHLRSVSAEGAPIVPPSGLMLWEPRPDLFPHGFSDLRARLGDLPLIFHSRHFASQSPYFERFDAWRDGDYAHPKDEHLSAEMLAGAASWGAITYEQDWMVESFLGVRGLRAEPGRARAWQESLDRLAEANGLTLQWCMASPADFLQTLTLRRVTSIRTSGDYRYLFDNGFNWVWFLHTNALARALGLNVFKDVFLSHASDAEAGGEPCTEVESLLAALSAGPVGIGDRIGGTNRDLVLRTCREDGVLVKPDAPIAAIARCFRANSYWSASLLVGETYSTHPAGRWVYVATLHAGSRPERIAGRVELADLGAVRPSGPVIVYDWRRQTWQRVAADGGWDVDLEHQGWDYRVLCPLLPGECAVFGDVSKYATAGDRRVAAISADADHLRFAVEGALDTAVDVRGYAATAPAFVEVTSGARTRALPQARGDATAPEFYRWEEKSGGWEIRVLLHDDGSVNVLVGWPLGSRGK